MRREWKTMRVHVSKNKLPKICWSLNIFKE